MTISLERTWSSSYQSAVLPLHPPELRVLNPSTPHTTGRSRRTARRIQRQICLDTVVAALASSLTFPAGSTTIVYSLLWVLAIGAARGYESRLLPPSHEDIRRLIRAGLGIAVAGAVLTRSALLPVTPERWFTLTAAVVLLSLGHRGVERLWYGRHPGRDTHLVVAGQAADIDRFVAELEYSPWAGARVTGWSVPADRPTAPEKGDDPASGLEQLAAVAADADAVVVLPCQELCSSAMRRLGWQLGENGTQLFVAPALLDIDPHRATLASAGAIPMLHLRAPEITGVRRLVKEVLERGLALIALLMLGPFILLVGVAVRLDSSGPAFYRQLRVGRGRTFRMWKFRTMHVGAESGLAELSAHNDADGVLFKVREDPRMTRLGRLLRRYSIDEIPQLLNVVCGQMAIVGPRPPLPAEVAQYDPDTHRRLTVKPGITGLWQVSGRSDLGWDEGVRLDLRYVDNWSLMLDLRILARTMRAVVSHTGAY